MEKIKLILKRKVSWVIIIFLLFGGYYYFSKVKGSGTAAASYVTSTVSQGTITTSVSGTGQVATSNKVDINPGSSGKVTGVFVKEGDTVKAGQTIATLDQASAANQITQAKVSLETAQANYDKLLAGDSNSVQTAQLNVTAAEQALQNAKDNYDQVARDQDKAIAKAYNNLLSGGLALAPSDTLTTVPVTLTGTYTGSSAGSFVISLSQVGSGERYQTSGLGDGSGVIMRGLAQPLGNGLYITFGTGGVFFDSTTWTINVPNLQSSNYATNKTVYDDAIYNKPVALKQAQEQIDSAQNSLTQAQSQLGQKQQPPTQADIDAAKVAILSAQVSLANADTTFNNTLIKAPFDGVVSTLGLTVGQEAGPSLVAATEITQQDIAQITLNEVDAAKVKTGQKATLTFAALPNFSLTGTVAQVASLGTVSQNVVNFTVKIAFDVQDDHVKPGMSVTASIVTGVAQNVLIVPSPAVKSNNNGSFVQVLVNGQPQEVVVTTGLSDSLNTEVSGSLKEGDNVITQTITASSKKPAAAASGNILQSLGAGGRGVGGGSGGFGGRTGNGN